MRARMPGADHLRQTGSVQRIRKIGLQLLGRAETMFQWWHRIRDGTLTRRTFQRRMRHVERSVGRLLRRAAACGDAKIEGMAKEILTHEPALWTFVHAEGVEPTNNRAERALRNAVTRGSLCVTPSSVQKVKRSLVCGIATRTAVTARACA